jgi:hypothetical protein
MKMKPKCIIVTGRPGSGKTTLAKSLAEHLWMPLISRDAIKEGYVNTFGIKHDQLPSDTNGVVNNLFFDIVNQHLAGMVSVVIEAAFQHKLWEPRMGMIQELGNQVVLVCSVDGLVAAKRHLQRGLDDSRREFFHGDKRVSIFRETGVFSAGDYSPPNFAVPTIQVSTADKYEPSINDMVSMIQVKEAQQPHAADAEDRRR